MKQFKLFYGTFLVLFVVNHLHAQSLTVGEEVIQQYESTHPYPLSINGIDEIVWSQEITYTEKAATYIAVHFSQFNLGNGDKLVLRSPDKSRQWEYTERDNVRGEFWSIPIYGDKVIIEIIANSTSNSFGYFIDKIVRGFTQSEIQSVNGLRSICGEDDTEEAKCYELSEPTVYNNSKAVARLWLNGVINCTGWLVGDEGHLMTCNHCIEDATDANNSTVEMMAEGPDCATNCQTAGGCPGTIVASSVNLIQTNGSLDYSLVKLDNNVSGTYGFLTMNEHGPSLNDQVYIPQHPAGWGKRIALVSDNANDTDGFIHVHTLDEPSCWIVNDLNRVGYYGDTRGGSSGSPVISYKEHCVVALHGCGGCPNNGANTSLIVSDLTYIPNNAICGHETACGEGSDINIYGPVTYNVDMDVPSNIFVHAGAQLTVTAKLKFGKNKQLVVLQGGKLIVEDGHLTKCDEADDWQGILVEGYSNLAQPLVSSTPIGGQAGIVHIRNNSLIEWARTAISTNYYGSWTDQKWGGLVVCENSEFLNNNRVGEFMKYDFINKSRFINCTLDGNSSILGTTAGVTIYLGYRWNYFQSKSFL